VILAGDADYPAFCRVIWNAHVREMTDLAPAGRARLMAVVFAAERALRDALHPAKVNLASLGNQVPHLHWHVIPRFEDDAHFPDPVWAPRRREGVAYPVEPEVLARALSAILRNNRG
jgi:diadenosine tetraphosphate (Ap4A) HIT family hydrolase